MDKEKLVSNQYSQIQQDICKILEDADGKGKFAKNPWQKKLGHGLACVMEKGNIIEKAGVNFSFVSGVLQENMQRTLEIDSDEQLTYYATGISSIIHSTNPFVPTIHLNVRYFGLGNGIEWFGGGIDLTPIYIDNEEAKLFHNQLKDLCDGYDPSYYPKYKTWADDYFYLPHREETRGVGGIFFDRLKPLNDSNFDHLFAFTKDLANIYPKIYSKIMNNKGNIEFTEAHKDWQKLRRGRYVEFNLLFDRGTKFGIETGGNTEAILVSMPPDASWEYKQDPAKGSPEAETINMLQKGIDWINI